MEVLATLHKLWGTGTLQMWGEESMWLAGVLNLLDWSEEVDKGEREEIKRGFDISVEFHNGRC